MKYQYFISFIIEKDLDYKWGYGNTKIIFFHKISGIEDIRWAEQKIKEETKAKNIVILNYQLLKKYKDEV